jgi:hypothetical protein
MQRITGAEVRKRRGIAGLGAEALTIGLPERPVLFDNPRGCGMVDPLK